MNIQKELRQQMEEILLLKSHIVVQEVIVPLKKIIICIEINYQVKAQERIIMRIYQKVEKIY